MGRIITVNTDPYKLWGDDWKPEPSQTPEEYRDYLYGNNRYYNQYLTIDITGYNKPQDIRFIIPAEIGTDLVTSVSYSMNNGLNWITVNNADNTQKQLYIDGLDFEESTKILFKGVAKQYAANINGTMKYCYFRFGTGANGSDIYGNILSMFYGENFADEVGFPENSSLNCYYMFKSADCTNIHNIILPVLTTEGCYMNMFNGHVNVTKTPLLPALTLSKQCYISMFDICKLECIQILATDISAENCLAGYIDDGAVAASGIFIKNDNADASMFGGYIPTGWTVKNYEPPKHYTLYVDKFPPQTVEEDDGGVDYTDAGYTREEYIAAEVAAAGVDDDHNWMFDVYEYWGDTLEYDGNTYYVCDNESMQLLLSTDDYDTLLSESIAESGNDTQFTSLVYVFNDGDVYDDNTDFNRQLLKIINNERQGD